MMVTNLPAATLSVSLEYYRGHKQLLSVGAYQALGTAAKVEAFREHNTIPLADFLNYFLIRRAKSPEYATYLDRLEHLDRAAGWLHGVMSLNGTINWQPGSDRMQEEVGEAVSLSVAGALFGLTEADWTKIPEQQGPDAHSTFDFERTIMGISSNDAVVQIEAKGTFVDDNTKGQPNVRTHASNIKAKKKNIKDAGDGYQHPAAALYGMIVSIDPLNDAKCFLLDPPLRPFLGEPRNLKIASRLDYVADLTEMLAPKAKLHAAVRTNAQSWREGSNENADLEGSPFTAGNYIETYFSKNKVFLADRDVVGEVFVGESGVPFFLGVEGDLVRVAIKQDPDEIVALSFIPGVEIRTIFAEPRRIDSWDKGVGRRFNFQLYTSSSGVVIGLQTGHIK
jgi:hypothetical protein